MSLLPRSKRDFEPKISNFLSPILVELIVKKPMLSSFQPKTSFGSSFFCDFFNKKNSKVGSRPLAISPQKAMHP